MLVRHDISELSHQTSQLEYVLVMMMQDTAGTSDASPFLSCLDQLNDDVWSSVLFPKLAAAKSAANVALVCSRLRHLCHGNCLTLNLLPLASSSDPSVAVAWTDAAVEHFPNVTTVKLSILEDASYVVTPSLMSALAR